MEPTRHDVLMQANRKDLPRGTTPNDILRAFAYDDTVQLSPLVAILYYAAASETPLAVPVQSVGAGFRLAPAQRQDVLMMIEQMQYHLRRLFLATGDKSFMRALAAMNAL